MNDLADLCVWALADAFRGDGEIFASGMGTIPMLAARLARATFEPDLLVSDGEAFFVSGELPLGAADKVVEGWIPFRSVFDTLWSGRRHVVMGASQIDRDGNQNIANIGPWERPKAQLLGVRGAPGNTANHVTSYFVPSHSPRVFVKHVDMVSGIGYGRAAGAGGWVRAHHEIRRVVTDKAVLDFEGRDHAPRLRSVHPGVTVGEVERLTGFALEIAPDVPVTPGPGPDALAVLDVLDPGRLRDREVRA